MALSPGARLGPYEIVSALGAGGMGEVYRARDTRLKREVAIKILPDAFAQDSDRLARFQREAELLASLNHPNIAGVFGLEQSALVLELVEGETLADRIARGPLPLDEALPIAKQITEALEAAHERGIIHRDLKPANIKITPDGKVKVLDFGLAKALASDQASATAGLSQSPTITSPAMVTGGGVILGTAAYMSPEQARGKVVDKRTEAHALAPAAASERARYPFWSPDGKSVGFSAGNALWRADTSGSPPVLLANLPGEAWASWTGDRILYESPDGLMQMPAAGGSSSVLTEPDKAAGEISHAGLQLLPDGRVMFFAVRRDSQAGTTYVVSTTDPRSRTQIEVGGRRVLFAADASGQGFLLWREGGSLLGQAFDLAALKLVGKPQKITDDPGANNPRMMNIAAAGSVLAYQRYQSMTQFVWMDEAGVTEAPFGSPREIATGRLSPDGQQGMIGIKNDLWLLQADRDVLTRFTSDGNRNTQPVWSPDGRSVVFRAGFPANLYHKEIEGSPQRRLTASPEGQFPTDWSADGKFVIYHQQASDTKSDLWVLPMSGADVKPRPYLRSSFSEGEARFEPSLHPQWVAYQSDETGENEVYLQRFPDLGGMLRVSLHGGRAPMWSPAGDRLYYASPDGKMMGVTLTRAGNGIVSSVPRELFQLPVPTSSGANYSIRPDGKRFLVQVPAANPEPLTVIENWSALLKN